MSFFKKLFSSDYRRAVALEGAGRYREAAEHYMLAGMRGEVGRMHRLHAGSERDPYARVDALRKALDFIDGRDPEQRGLLASARRDMADALVALADHSGLMDRRDRGLLEEAAAIYVEQESHEQAGEVFSRLGFLNKAAEAFKTAGNIGRMEEMFHQVEAVDLSEAAFDRAWDAYEFARMAGDPIGAIEALRRCVELRPQDAGLHARLQELELRMPTSGRLTLKGAGGEPLVLVGGDALGIGREDDNELLVLDPGISRQHARICLQNGAVVLEDLGSSHGTWIDGHRLERPTPLGEQGRFRVGRDVTIQYRFRPGCQPPAIFEIASGHLKGQRFTWTPRLLTCGVPPEEPAWMPPGLALEFRRGYWHVVPSACHETVSLEGRALTAPTMLRLKDELAVGDVTLRVE